MYNSSIYFFLKTKCCVRASWILQLAVRAIGARFDAINAGPAGVGAKLTRRHCVGNDDAGQNEETQDGCTHWRCVTDGQNEVR